MSPYTIKWANLVERRSPFKRRYPKSGTMLLQSRSDVLPAPVPQVQVSLSKGTRAFARVPAQSRRPPSGGAGNDMLKWAGKNFS